MSESFVTLGNFSQEEAQVVHSILEEAGITCYLLGEDQITSGAGFGAVGGVEIRVPEEQLEHARKILEEAKE